LFYSEGKLERKKGTEKDKGMYAIQKNKRVKA
jgi:hypothetical protein